jgi:hypothetical protein
VAALFPGTPLDGMLVIPTCQHAAVDLVQMGERVETEKDRLLERVGGWVGALSLCSSGCQLEQGETVHA